MNITLSADAELIKKGGVCQGAQHVVESTGQRLSEQQMNLWIWHTQWAGALIASSNFPGMRFMVATVMDDAMFY